MIQLLIKIECEIIQGRENEIQIDSIRYNSCLNKFHLISPHGFHVKDFFFQFQLSFLSPEFSSQHEITCSSRLACCFISHRITIDLEDHILFFLDDAYFVLSHNGRYGEILIAQSFFSRPSSCLHLSVHCSVQRILISFIFRPRNS